MLDNRINSYKEGPDENGRFGVFGGRFVSETLMPLILEVEKQQIDNLQQSILNAAKDNI